MEDIFSGDNQFLTAGLVLGTITASLLYLKTFFIWIWERIERKLLYEVYIDNASDMYIAFSEWYSKNYPNKFTSIEILTRKTENGIVPTQTQYKDWNTIWRRRRMIHVVKQKSILENAKDQESRNMDMYYIFGFWAKKAIDEMMDLAIKEYNIRANTYKGVKVVHPTPYDYNEIPDKYLTNVKSLKHIFGPEKEIIVRDIERFLASKDSYLEKGIRFKRNYLLSGLGGTGKSTIALAVAEWLHRPIYYIKPTAIAGDYEFDRTVYNIPEGSIVVIEDIDIFFTDRENTDGPTKVSFQAILNFLDGATSLSNVLTFMTTNCPEKLDPALLRKGRADLHIPYGYADAESISSFVSMFYGEPMKVYNPIEATMSTVQEACLTASKEEILSLLEKGT